MINALLMAEKYQPIKDWPEEDRPREKLLQRGPENLTEAELIAILLRTGNTGQSAQIAEMAAVKGIGPAKSAQLKAGLELGRRLARQKWETGRALKSAEDVYRDFSDRLGKQKREMFYVVLLTNKNKKIREVKISEGSLTASLVHPREVFNPVIRESAAAVIFVHNHPSGDPAPSPEDIDITKRLKQVGEVMGVRVLDHVVIGHGRYYSFSDKGML